MGASTMLALPLDECALYGALVPSWCALVVRDAPDLPSRHLREVPPCSSAQERGRGSTT
ncbi:uncharacterized protein RHOBADRAFT_64663 [Rhodotorula graminis WP1]|uniref:Uncharacterized protein n=1 Tax=Rhodotorula graminis (strain WP1) TaxID=578459 RepID=A0A194S9J9_RHOGW|nr:uncharacterized protein RHOBADRAFT_64663 [Rhodotorula graminis WP1]KPV77140.1 hypothetical protein RHOBADRAFT_64663 [Rhodotorula graminis WP1]